MDNNSNHKREDQEDDKVTIATDGIIPDDCDIPEWVIEESQVLSREVTPHNHCSSVTKGSVKMETAARRLSLECYTLSTA